MSLRSKFKLPVLSRVWRKVEDAAPPDDRGMSAQNSVPAPVLKVCELPADFSEQDYLSLNADVAALVAQGHLASGAEHYRHYGFRESRLLYRDKRPAPLTLPFPEGAPVDRRDKVLANLDLERMNGVEIGALATPLVKRSEGKIFYVDHVDTETVKRKYSNDPSVKADDIVDIDAVWGSQTLSECVGHETFDYVVNSHVIEHVPDFIEWLFEIKTVLKPGGELRLLIPDKRYTFDYLRQESRLHDVLDAYLRKTRVPLPRTLIEFFSLARDVNCVDAWNGDLDVASLAPMNSTEIGMALAKEVINDKNAYHDVHCWVFTPQSFAELCLELSRINLMKFKFTNCFDTERYQIEFTVHMKACDDSAEIAESWAEMKRLLTTPAR